MWLFKTLYNFIDYLVKLNNSSATHLAQRFLEDNILDTAENNQIKFLSSLNYTPSKDKLINIDWDKDKLTNCEEVNLGTNYNKKDSDEDGLDDGNEVKEYNTNPLKKDSDDDTLDDSLEITLGTNPTDPDTDGDGLDDGNEVNIYHTDPKNKDSDGDGHSDLEEIVAGSNPLDPTSTPRDKDSDSLLDDWENKYFGNLNQGPNNDPDLDNLTNIKEQQYNTNPLKKDTSGDGLSDKVALDLGLNPTERYNSSFVNLLFKLNSNEQIEFINKFVKNGNLSREGLEQAMFLNSLDTAEFQYIKDNNFLTNLDIDGDNIGNYVDENLMNLSFKIPNERYFIFLETDIENPPGYLVPFSPTNPNGNIWDQRRFILKKHDFNPDNIYTLLGKNATFNNFENLILNNISSKITNNDLVYIQLKGHGVPEKFVFADNERVTYENIDNIIDTLIPKQLVIATYACDCMTNESLTPLIEGPCPRLVLGGENILLYARTGGKWGDIFLGELDRIDQNNDQYISMNESFNNKYNPGLHDFRDEYNIFNKMFLGDATVEELHVDIPPRP